MTTAQNVLNIARQYLGANKYGATHVAIVSAYNAHRPLAQGYLLKNSDDWCAGFVSFVMIKAGLASSVGTEVGVQRYIGIFQNKGIWIGRTSNPQPGDIITWDWDGGGFADHIGLVESVANGYVNTIEGNTFKNGVSTVGRNSFRLNDTRIKGYARPKYSNSSSVALPPKPITKKSTAEIAVAVIRGDYGIGQTRVNKLQAEGYNAVEVQKEVNRILSGSSASSNTTTADVLKPSIPLPARPSDFAKAQEVYVSLDGKTLSNETAKELLRLAEHYDLNPVFLLCMLYLESGFGTSNVARLDTNWAGMTYPPSLTSNIHTRPSGVQVTRGSNRPASEGGHYMKYASVNDFLADWTYLLARQGIYQVAGAHDFASAVKGLFRIGGAKYDYAAAGYEKYVGLMNSIKSRLESSNAGKLEALLASATDETVSSKTTAELIDQLIDIANEIKKNTLK